MNIYLNQRKMNIETLKKLIEVEFERSETTSQFKQEVFRLLDLYASESMSPFFVPNQPINKPVDGKVPYFEICGCNPKNGGSGICGCTIGNKLVDRNVNVTSTTTTGTGSISSATGKINSTSYQGGAPYSWTYTNTSDVE